MDFTDVSGCEVKLSDSSDLNEAELSTRPESEIGLKRNGSVDTPACPDLGIVGKGGLEPRLCGVADKEGLVCMDRERLAPVSIPLSKLTLSMVCDADDTGELWASMPASDFEADTQLR